MALVLCIPFAQYDETVKQDLLLNEHNLNKTWANNNLQVRSISLKNTLGKNNDPTNQEIVSFSILE